MKTIEVDGRPPEVLKMLFLIALGVVIVLGSIWFLVDPPREAIWGNGTLFPRIIALTSGPAAVYMILWAVYVLLRRNPLLTINDQGVIAKTQPPRTRRSDWQSITEVKKRGKTTVVLSRGPGSDIKIFTEHLAEEWTPDLITEAIRSAWK